MFSYIAYDLEFDFICLLIPFKELLDVQNVLLRH